MFSYSQRKKTVASDPFLPIIIEGTLCFQNLPKLVAHAGTLSNWSLRFYVHRTMFTSCALTNKIKRCSSFSVTTDNTEHKCNNYSTYLIVGQIV